MLIRIPQLFVTIHSPTSTALHIPEVRPTQTSHFHHFRCPHASSQRSSVTGYAKCPSPCTPSACFLLFLARLQVFRVENVRNPQPLCPGFQVLFRFGREKNSMVLRSSHNSHLGRTSPKISDSLSLMWGSPKVGVPFWGVPIVRIIVFGGMLGGTPSLGNTYVVSTGRSPSKCLAITFRLRLGQRAAQVLPRVLQAQCCPIEDSEV